MRVGLELGQAIDFDALACADEFGLWAVAVSGAPGAEMVRAAQVVERTEHLRVVVRLDLCSEHAFTIAEEIAVLDNLSGGRIGVIITAAPAPEAVDDFREALIGRPKGGVVLSPPTVQTQVPTWLDMPGTAEDVPLVADRIAALTVKPGSATPGQAALCGVLGTDRVTIDEWRDAGCTHLLVSWPGPLKVLARHLVTRAATADFPSVVAEMADKLDQNKTSS